MSCTGATDAPPARGVPGRDIWKPADAVAGIGRLNADLGAAGSTFRAWPSDIWRVWVTRATSGTGAVGGKPGLFTGCGEALDADNPAAMRALLEDLGVLRPEPGWLTSTEVGALWRVDRQAVGRWVRGGKFPRRSVRRAPDGTWLFREDVMLALLEQAVAEAAA